jgi:glutathione S-transferase
MLMLHGRPRSNYYNAVKALLIEKDIAFEEVLETVPPSKEFLKISPMSKVPCLVTPSGPITETTAILEYVEETHPEVPMMPDDAYARAKLRELCKTLELYIEWAARRGYGALRGEEVAEHEKAGIEKTLTQSASAVNHLASFSPWITGEDFTCADIFGYFMLVYAIPSAKANADIDLLAAIPGSADWFANVEQRPSMQRVLADAREYAKSLR